MFYTDNPIIREYAWSGIDEMYRTLVFVRMTIRRRLEVVRPLLDMVIVDGRECLSMAVERRSVTELGDLASYLIYNCGIDMEPVELMRHAVRVYGIGIPKAGFIVQLLTGKVGCLDTHNLKLYGIKDSFRADGPWKVIEARIATYVSLCQHVGGSRYLWDTWCTHVAMLRPKVWESAEAVSQYHVDTICGL